jgi:hypothetical protein
MLPTDTTNRLSGAYNRGGDRDNRAARKEIVTQQAKKWSSRYKAKRRKTSRARLAKIKIEDPNLYRSICDKKMRVIGSDGWAKNKFAQTRCVKKTAENISASRHKISRALTTPKCASLSVFMCLAISWQLRRCPLQPFDLSERLG